jgi:pimeloyl-ACP methyl ester carboxylesterase
VSLAALDGVTLEYQSLAGGEPILFIHGALIADTFQPLFHEPTLANYRRVVYHRRGYAASRPAPPQFSIAEQAADCVRLLRHLDIGSAHVVGHSFGGVVALQLAMESPSMVRSLALLEPALIVGESGPGYRESLAQGVQHFRETEPAAVVDEMARARWPAYRDRLEQILPGAFERAVRDSAASFEAELPALLAWGFSEEQAGKITQPVLSVLGAESPSLSPRFLEVHEWLLNHVSNAQGFVLPQAHHFLQVENPLDMAAALAKFLAGKPLT